MGYVVVEPSTSAWREMSLGVADSPSQLYRTASLDQSVSSIGTNSANGSNNNLAGIPAVLASSSRTLPVSVIGTQRSGNRNRPQSSSSQEKGPRNSHSNSNMMHILEANRRREQNSRSNARADALESFLASLRAKNMIDVDQPGFVESMREHFELLPSRYATNVNTTSLDVLNHKRLLDSARSDPSAVSFQVRSVDVMGLHSVKSFGSLGSSQANSYSHLRAIGEAAMGLHSQSQRSLPRPAFGSSPNLAGLVDDLDEEYSDGGQGAGGRDRTSRDLRNYVFYEVTIASVDQSKLLMRLSESLGDIGLNICEAHAFNTKDRFVLDVFVVNGWNDPGGVDALEDVLSMRLQELPMPGDSLRKGGNEDTSPGKGEKADIQQMTQMMAQSTVDDDWEIDPSDIVFQEKIASGAFGDLFKGVFCGQDVAIKILRGVQDNSVQYQEFLQEVAIMRKVRHRNVVQFIGACTKKPHLCIVFEYMKGGSVYDRLRSEKGAFSIVEVLRVAAEVSRGMNYLHQRKILHRDLKAANLLIDEHGTVKIADFGVARLLDTEGVMTAETGTYRWMAPEIIEHKAYDQKADVYSFGIVLWELLTGSVPYQDRTPLQAAVGVVQNGLRPDIPPSTPAGIADIMRLCWQREPSVRPSFETLKKKFEDMYDKALAQAVEAGSKSAKKGGGGIFGRLKGSGKA